MWCLRFAIWRKCGSECRNGCDLGALRGGFWRLRIGFGGLEVVLIGLFISKMVVRIVKTEFSCFVFFIFQGWFAGIRLRMWCLRFAMPGIVSPERGCSGWKRGLLCGESGVCVIGLFRFRVVKRKRTPCGVPKNKMKKSNTGSTNLFLLFRFRRLRGAKVVFFLLISAKTVFVFRVFNRCFQCFRGSLRVFMVQMRRSRTSKR